MGGWLLECRKGSLLAQQLLGRCDPAARKADREICDIKASGATPCGAQAFRQSRWCRFAPRRGMGRRHRIRECGSRPAAAGQRKPAHGRRLGGSGLRAKWCRPQGQSPRAWSRTGQAWTRPARPSDAGVPPATLQVPDVASRIPTCGCVLSMAQLELSLAAVRASNSRRALPGVRASVGWCRAKRRALDAIGLASGSLRLADAKLRALRPRA